MTPREEAIFDIKAESYFKGHRGTPKGYDSRVLCQGGYRDKPERKELQKKYNENFDKTFPNAPGAGL